MDPKEAYWEFEKRLYDDRIKFGTEWIKVLLLINGGAAVALLAFLQAVWRNESQLGLLYPILIALFLFAIGVGVAAPINYLRIISHEARSKILQAQFFAIEGVTEEDRRKEIEEQRKRMKKLAWWNNGLGWLSITCFFISVVSVAGGVWYNLL